MGGNLQPGDNRCVDAAWRHARRVSVKGQRDFLDLEPDSLGSRTQPDGSGDSREAPARLSWR